VSPRQSKSASANSISEKRGKKREGRRIRQHVGVRSKATTCRAFFARKKEERKKGSVGIAGDAENVAAAG